VDPEAPGILLEQIKLDARHLRQMAWARLICAVALFGGSLGLSAYFVAVEAAGWGAVSAAGGGTVTVVAMLLTGRPPALRSK
jgi:hypothetical protein